MRQTITVTSNSLYFSENVPVYVNRVTESFRLEQHRHEFFEFSYVGEGRGYHYIEGETIPVSKGDAFYLPIGVSHVFRPSTPSPGVGRLIVYNCIFDERFADRLLQALEPDSRLRAMLERSFPEQPWVRVRDADGSLQRAFDVMLEECRQRRPDYLTVVQAETLRLLVQFARLQEAAPGGNEDAAKPPGRPRDTDASLDRMAERMRRFPGDEHLARAYAEEAGLSERHLRRRFKERFGMSFLDYLHKCRIEYCCERLAATNEKVASIALQAGYRDMKYFNALFKNATGLTPRAYRGQRTSP
ncbi:AraC family transcriptional regulator [Paenibacillus sp.]|uniref:AraC family transcriptional regulator n=1 Tax=Paenibacillus sp. TaxID=58172 RepID=UPI002D374E85|nr:AraC family transcriptional regulator [Paenibacillus sp.]HZG56843.1 AraC family transcriptional regulator [Paenibacillus sp.]